MQYTNITFSRSSKNFIICAACKNKIYKNTQPLSYSHYTGQPALAGTSSYELEDFVDAKFYCLHALADGNQYSWIREKMLEFSSTVMLCTLRDLR